MWLPRYVLNYKSNLLNVIPNIRVPYITSIPTNTSSIYSVGLTPDSSLIPHYKTAVYSYNEMRILHSTNSQKWEFVHGFANVFCSVDISYQQEVLSDCILSPVSIISEGKSKYYLHNAVSYLQVSIICTNLWDLSREITPWKNGS